MSIRLSKVLAVALTGFVCLGQAEVAGAAIVTINSKTFDLDQFTGATVTYRADGSVSFAGKLWDNEVGVDQVTLAELASGQFGSDPGDQVSLNSTGAAGPDWLQLNYAGPGVAISNTASEFVIYEISSSNSGVDTEGTSFRVSFNGGAFNNASDGVVTFLPAASLPGSPNVENTNQIVFDLLSLGFNPGDTLSTVRIENLDSGSGTSDPDFIFAATVIPEPASLALLTLGGLTLIRRRTAP